MATCAKCGKDVAAFGVIDPATGRGTCEPCMTGKPAVQVSAVVAPSTPVAQPAKPASVPAKVIKKIEVKKEAAKKKR